MVCTQKYNLVPILAKCLGDSISDDENDMENARRLICLTLNQLSLPFHNKNAMVFGNGSSLLLENLLQIINHRFPESYLCCICFMNLSYLENAVDTILNITTKHSKRPNNIDPEKWVDFHSADHVPASRAPSPVKGFNIRGNSTNKSPCIDDTKSLLRSIERLLHEYRPFLMSNILSHEGEAIRWSVGLLRNLTKTEAHCSIMAVTEIPFLILSFIRQSPNPIIRWSKDSLEAMSLSVLQNFATFTVTKSLLITYNAIEVVRQLDEERKRLDLGLNTAAILQSLKV